MHHDELLCAALPQTVYSLMWSYCGHHQAWRAQSMIYDQEGDDTRVRYSEGMAFGPFDTFEDVLRWLEVEFAHLR